MTDSGLDLSAFCVPGEPIPYAEAVRGPFQPFAVGGAWGPPWSTTWFHVTGRVPDPWIGRRVVAVFDLGFDGPTGFTCEALAWRQGKPWRGVDPNHRWLPIEGPEVDFYLEAAANPRATEQGAEPAPSMIAMRSSPEPAFVFRSARLALVEASEPSPERLQVDPSHKVTAVGHAHIDTAWEWPIRETKRKVARSWSTQLELMEAYPDYVFAASQPVHYAWMKDLHPDIYTRIKQRVAEGRWEPVGAMWVEPDCNLPSGESLARQLLYGQRFLAKEFGLTTRIAWLPDAFGYPGNLPQLLKSAGCDFFLTQKLSWNDTNKPEHHTFLWEGIDGTQVFAHFPPADTYNGNFTAEEVEYSVRNFKDSQRSSRSLYLFGWGDGGGGPQPEMIDAAHRLGVEIGTATGFFEDAAREARDLTTLRGELYFELHRGTYTSQARTKLWNRRAQSALRDAEMWSVAAGSDYPREELELAWRTLLVDQFHDILPGSSIDWVYEDAIRELTDVDRTANNLAQDAIARIAASGERIAVFNSSSHPRGGAPACGWAVVPATSRDLGVSVNEHSIENELLRVEWDGRGLLTSVYDKEALREVLSGPGNVLRLHDDNPARWDAWDLDINYLDSFIDLVDVDEMSLDSAGLRIARRFGSSSLRQRIWLDGHSRVIRFETEVDWRERHKMLKVAFPVGVSSPEAVYEIQFGHVTRPTHWDDSRARAMFEVPAQRWADLGDGRYGVALLNDSKHGYDIHGSVMRLSLLRAPTHPDPNADQGPHRFVYALMPHPGDFRIAGVIQAADELNSPLRMVATSLPAGSSRSLVRVDTRQVVVEAIKRAEDSDAVIVRLYEAWGRPCRARIQTSIHHVNAHLCDVLERDLRALPTDGSTLELDFGPFAVATLKLE